MKDHNMNEKIDYLHSNIILETSYEDFRKFIPADKLKRTIIITDNNIKPLYSNSFGELPVIEINAGEESKSMVTILSICSQLLEIGADRHSFLLGFGGGVVCDICGFVASIYMRGIEFAYVSTSLLSQVDASIGGKTGINFQSFKNILGAFNHPEFVLCDQKVLATLPESEFINGLGEVVKHAFIADKEMFEFLKDKSEIILDRDELSMKYLIRRSIEIKSSIVNQDERESGMRKLLNFGHTLGHAIEVNSKYNHGEAISIGMVMAAKCSHEFGYCSKLIIGELENLLTALSLPIKCDIDKNILFEAIQKDKKKKANMIDFVFVEDIAKPRIEKVDPSSIQKAV